MADRFRIRPAELTDVPAVHAIEQRVFADPWSTQDFRDCVSFARDALPAPPRRHRKRC